MAVDRVTRYCQRIVAGKVPAGTLHRLACQRHLSDLESRASRGLIWTPGKVDAVQRFAGQCPHLQGTLAGQPIHLEDWELFIIASILGWTKADGLRRFRTAFSEMPRGNGKSTLAAVLMLYLTFFDGEKGAHGFVVATKKDQARIVFDYCRDMVLRSPSLRRHVDARQLYNLHSLATASKMQALGADADTLDGLRPHACCADEVHKHPDARVIDVMQTGMGTRDQPVLFEITTAGDASQRESVWWAHRKYVQQVLEGVLEDDTWFGFVAGADLEDNWTDERIWRKGNPNYAISVRPDDIARKCEQAKAMPGYQNTFRRLHLGQIVEQNERYLPMEQWDRAEASRPVDLSELEGRPCFGGLDLSTTTDLSAFVLVWPLPDGAYTVVPWFWVPQDNISDRSRRDRVGYDVWSRDGYLTATPGNVVDYAFIHHTLADVCARFRPVSIGFDPWNSSSLVTSLLESGAPMVKVSQGIASLSAPTKELARLLAAGKLQHGGHPVLRWNAANLVVRYDTAGNCKPDKSQSRKTERNDGIVALVIALSLATSHQQPAPPAYQVMFFGKGAR